ncbi:L,D-transpeptidase family protein [Sandarakinorhabdus sp. DWP1-3-1]|uniref:L,D-transpeptidase family protein n=1 Tax=Sandarakinorhabdus sp. DWP1-3-1 TaxID=2804627 RepID=UPI003CF0B270
MPNLGVPRWLLPVVLSFAIAAPAAAQPADLRAAIRSEARGKVRDFYATRGFQPLWAADGAIPPQAAALVDDLATADADGLKPSSYKPQKLLDAIAAARGGDARAVARAEVLLSTSLARYVRDLRKPRGGDEMTWLDPRLKPAKLAPDAVLRAAALPQPFADYVATMGWMSPHYLRLRRQVMRARADGADRETLDRLRRNLDRARVLPGPWTHHVVVDASSGRLWYYQAGRQLGAMKVVVGRPETPTPMLAGMLQYAVLNPYWNVPVDLAQTLVAPKVLAGRSLKAMGYEALSDWSVAPQRLPASAIDWPAVAAGTQELRLRQLPGGANSMGRVKFMFPNDLGIYLHDTPDRHLFKPADRHFSNGCIRLEDAPALGKWLLGRPIRGAGRAPEQAVPLAAPVPVYLTYLTVQDDGVGFREDVYGRDR